MESVAMLLSRFEAAADACRFMLLGSSEFFPTTTSFTFLPGHRCPEIATIFSCLCNFHRLRLHVAALGFFKKNDLQKNNRVITTFSQCFFAPHFSWESVPPAEQMFLQKKKSYSHDQKCLLTGPSDEVKGACRVVASLRSIIRSEVEGGAFSINRDQVQCDGLNDHKIDRKEINEKRKLRERFDHAKAGYEMKVVKAFKRIDPLSFGVGLIMGCFLVSLTYTTSPKHDMLDFPILESKRSPSPTFASRPLEKFVTSEEPAGSKTTNDDPITTGSTMLEPAYTRGTTQTAAVEAPRKPLCDPSNHRSDICDVAGDVRVIGKNLSSVILVTAPQVAENLQPWVVQPYARKWDKGSLNHVRRVHVKAMHEAPRCTVRHAVPAVIFATAGYTGNYFHDFTDTLVPLFQTAREFDGEVQLVVSSYNPWWFKKYEEYITRISRYQVIDYDNDDRVHCFDRVIVGLRSDRDLMIDPAKSPKGYSMPDFMKFMRDSYGLGRDYAMNPAAHPGRKPRLLIVARGGTRKFMNVDEIVRMAESAGFEAVTTEAKYHGVAEFARVVNSCDVMMGVHGAGLTNFVFLPSNAVFIQVVPYGKLDWIASNYFGEPAKRMNISYLEYTIGVEESTLTELYPRDDPVFTDPVSIHKRGWHQMGEIYLVKQNVKLDVNRFRPVLEQALRLLSVQKPQ